jgi:hypothetical protein
MCLDNRFKGGNSFSKLGRRYRSSDKSGIKNNINYYNTARGFSFTNLAAVSDSYDLFKEMLP